MWIAMGGFLGLTAIIFVLGLFSAMAARKQRLQTRYRHALAEAKKREREREAEIKGSAIKESPMNTGPDYASLLGGQELAGTAQGRHR